MNSQNFRQLITLVEGRLPDVDYQETDKEVIAILTSRDSQVYTKLAQKYERMSQLKDEISALEDEVKQTVRDDVAGIFDAADAVKTRIVKTKSLIIQLSKDPEATKSPKYKDILVALVSHLTPELIAVVEKMKTTMVTITQKSAGVKIKSLDEGPQAQLADQVNQVIQSWAAEYDQKLESLAQQL